MICCLVIAWLVWELAEAAEEALEETTPRTVKKSETRVTASVLKQDPNT